MARPGPSALHVSRAATEKIVVVCPIVENVQEDSYPNAAAAAVMNVRSVNMVRLPVRVVAKFVLLECIMIIVVK